MKGKVNIDWRQNGGAFRFQAFVGQKDPAWETRWGSRSANSVYAIAGTPGLVAGARYATEFDQIDDPGAFDYESHFVEASEGEIVIFRNSHGYVLLKVMAVQGGPDWDTLTTCVTVAYQIRLLNE